MPNSKSTIYEVKMRVIKSRLTRVDLIKHLLTQHGFAIQDIAEFHMYDHDDLVLYASTRQEARRILRKIRALGLAHVRYSIRMLKKWDWLTKWKNDFRPFQLTSNIMVVPSWMRKRYCIRGRKQILLGEGMAFGTGQHPTTRFMAAFLQQCRGRYETVLDVGTGTGILSMVASLYGAKSVEAIDISEDAVQAARDNARLNQLTTMRVTRKDFAKRPLKERYDFVVANLITDDLIRLKRELAAVVKKGHFLAVSGIMINNYPRLARAFKALPLKRVKVLKEDGWAGVLYQRM